ncbi:MAG: Fe-S protein assembly co-chaperone HscB [Burkholderiaceae bacterium]|nr:Fe-S protein assembly co-chaperone HscB [Burkholderiaceae bacterium]
MISEAAGRLVDIGVPIDASDFELFQVASQFVQDRAVLDTRWKQLQTQVHPDRFVSDGAVAQRVAMQWTLRVNEAYQRLKLPLARAVYLCELNGQPIGAESNTAMPVDFLLQQMAWREALDEARSLGAVEALGDAVAARQRSLLDELSIVMDERRDWPAAALQIRALMFVTRFAEDVERRAEALGG